MPDARSLPAGGEPESIEDVLDRVEEAAGEERHTSVADIIDKIGDDAFAPLMLVPALLMVSPATAIFGFGTICAIIIATIAFQMLIGRKQLWLPQFILRQKMPSRHVERSVDFLTRPARAIDAMTRPRLSFLVDAPADRVWASLIIVLSLLVPFFELVPMSATIIGGSITLFGLAVLARDGLLAIFGLTILGAAAYLLWNVAT